MGRADSPLLLDVRRDEKFGQSAVRLAGALRCSPQQIHEFAASQPRRPVLVYCVYGHNISAYAVEVLRLAGWDAHALAGGCEGGEPGVDAEGQRQAWRQERAPVVAQKPEWGVTGENPSRWITRERPKIDRIACPWLVRRFIDPRAEFFYVPTASVLQEAERLGAVAYDIPGAPVSHDGELCSFDVLMRSFGLSASGLETLARIVRGADTDRLDLAPQSAGLMALSLGFSQLYANDHEMLEAAMPMYDALYAWCRNAQAEPHSWRPETMVAGARS